ncbi:hypothetical protein D3C77_542980 [compost metagenome]
MYFPRRRPRLAVKSCNLQNANSHLQQMHELPLIQCYFVLHLLNVHEIKMIAKQLCRPVIGIHTPIRSTIHSLPYFLQVLLAWDYLDDQAFSCKQSIKLSVICR